MNKEANITKAKKIFAAHSSKDQVHFSADGQGFFLESDCKNNAKTLNDKSIHTVKREEVTPRKIDAVFESDSEQDFQKLSGQAQENLAADRRDELEERYFDLFGEEPDESLSDKDLEKAIAEKEKADKKAADDKVKADNKAAADKEKADKKAADDKVKADNKAVADKEKADKKSADKTGTAEAAAGEDAS